MLLHVTAQKITLKQPQDLKNYSVHVESSALSQEKVLARHPELRRIDPQHVAVAQDLLKVLAGSYGDDPKWLSQFHKMTNYAQAKGWLTDTGEIIGHIE